MWLELWLDNDMSTSEQLKEATNEVDRLRGEYNTLRVGSKAWRQAAEDLDWWIGRKATLSRMAVAA